MSESSPEEPSEASESPPWPPSPLRSYVKILMVSAVVLLSLDNHYLTRNVDRGGAKAYSRSSLDFRDIYVATVLFLGAYVWIKFREVAPKGVLRRELKDRQDRTKVVYDARLKPPLWNGKKVPRLELGRFATEQEAHNKFLIAAFYYNRAGGLLDGWFQVPPMSEKERGFTGEEKRKWVIVQAKKVYEDFKKKEAEAALFQEFLKTWEGQATPGLDEVNLDPCGASLLNSAEPQQSALVSEVENSAMGLAMIGDNHGLECAYHSFDGMHEGLALPNGLSLGSQEEPALPNSESGISLNSSDELDLLQTRVGTQQQQIFLQQQQISDLQQQSSLQQQQFDRQQQLFSDQQRQFEELRAHVLQFRHQQHIQQQHFQESRIQNLQWSCQFCLQQQQLQVINPGFPGSEVEMEQSMHQHNYSGFMAPPRDGGEAQESF